MRRPCFLDTFAAIAALYEARPDKNWSLTDCTSFVFMQDLVASAKPSLPTIISRKLDSWHCLPDACPQRHDD
jgi:hypothetical protein